MKGKLKIAATVIVFAVILSLFLSVVVFSTMAVAIHFGFYNNVMVLGLVMSLALGVVLTAGTICIR